MKTLIIIAALALGGCVTTPEFKQQASASAADQCLLMGYEPGTTQYQACKRLVKSSLITQQENKVKRAWGAAAIGTQRLQNQRRTNTLYVYPR